MALTKITGEGTGSLDSLTTTGALDVTTSTHANASVFKSTGNTQIMLQDTDASANDQFWGLQVSGGEFNILTCNDDRASGFVTPLTIAQTGEVLIGTSTSGSSTCLNLTGTATLCKMKNESANGGTLQTTINFGNSSGTTVGTIKVNNSETTFNTSSDYRLKQDIEDMTGSIARVKALLPKQFKFIANPGKTVDGFLAHEAQAVVPGAVDGTKDEVDDDGNAVMQGIDHSKLVPLLTGALREAIAKIETLETKVAALEGS